jgi:UDP-N-acetylmuramyl pentapeptide synthase
MKNNIFPLTTHLAILQQAEYDVGLWRRWYQTTARADSVNEHLQTIQPDQWTLKIRLIRIVTSWLQHFSPIEQALPWAITFLSPLDSCLKWWQITRATGRLRRYQQRGLIVIAVAGSYGKTSLKHVIRHVVGSQFSTLMTPASFNTPLGIAGSICHLSARHQVFIVELGEYYPGDITKLLRWLRPTIGVLGPIGFAHLDRFGSGTALTQTLAEMSTSPSAPKTLIVDDMNRHLLQPGPQQTVIWYGRQAESELYWQTKKVALTSITGKVAWQNHSHTVEWPMLGEANATNALAAAAVGMVLGIPFRQTVQYLRYVPPTPRRLTVFAHPNGSYVVDNSYNTNPGSWQTTVQLWKQLKLDNLAIVTAGFVELDEPTALTAHIQMASDIAHRARIIGIVRTRDNHRLIKLLSDKIEGTTKHLYIGDTWDEVVAEITPHLPPQAVLWLEGGVRELYQ